jgi:DNA methylase
VRVLKPTGSLFVELGDKYSDRGHGPNRGNGTGRGPQGALLSQTRGPLEKSLLGLPWRYALACMDQTLPHVRADYLDSLIADILDGTIDHDTARQRLAEFDASPKSKGLGLILRRDIIWSKPNGLPESVTDRCRSSHEYVFHLVKQPRYYAAVDEIREAHARTWAAPGGSGNRGTSLAEGRLKNGTLATCDPNPLGKLPGSVWDIPSQPLTVPDWLGVDHFAAYPCALVRPIILGWSPPGICTACGEGRRPVAHVGKTFAPRPGLVTALTNAHGADGREGARPSSLATITGYACACTPFHWQEDDSARWKVYHFGRWTPPSTRPAVVVDPFGGTGTTALVASMYGRLGLSFDLSADYCRLARWRTTDPAQRAAAMQVPKPPPVMDGQLDLLDLVEVS